MDFSTMTPFWTYGFLFLTCTYWVLIKKVFLSGVTVKTKLSSRVLDPEDSSTALGLSSVSGRRDRVAVSKKLCVLYPRFGDWQCVSSLAVKRLASLCDLGRH